MTAFCGGYSVEYRCVGRRGEQAGFVRFAPSCQQSWSRSAWYRKPFV